MLNGMVCCPSKMNAVLLLACITGPVLWGVDGFSFLQQLPSDIKPTCCKAGYKVLQDVKVCDAPCCPGLREMSSAGAPFLGEIVWCQETPTQTQTQGGESRGQRRRSNKKSRKALRLAAAAAAAQRSSRLDSDTLSELWPRA